MFIILADLIVGEAAGEGGGACACGGMGVCGDGRDGGGGRR